ncbi:hypothetical protein [Streptomyces sp. NPDC046985]|uniref:hypothetical protein n=1 Tax=Streptomyces sp. NPDC046985 TaxID=3155377 RepID=UPI0033C83917
MPAPHGPLRAPIAVTDSAAEQMDATASEAELPALNRALVVVAVEPDVGEPLHGDGTGPRLRQYVGDVDPLRLLCWVSALQSAVVVAFIEV